MRLFYGWCKTPNVLISSSSLDLTPVDFVSYAVVTLGSRLDSVGWNFTLCNPTNLVNFSRLYKPLVQLREDNAEAVPFDQVFFQHSLFQVQR